MWGARDHRDRITRIAVARLSVGSSVGLATGVTARVFGVPRDQVTPAARLIARLFGVRNCVLGVWALSVRDASAAEQKRCFQLNAAVDIADLAMLMPLLARRGLRRTAIMSSVLAVNATLAWWELLQETGT